MLNSIRFVFPFLCFFALLAPLARAQTGAQEAPDAADPAISAKAANEENAGNSDADSSALDAQTVYEVVLGELAVQRQQIPLAARVYLDLALRSHDPEVIERALKLLSAAGEFVTASELLPLWKTYAQPDPSETAVIEAGIFLGLGRIAEMEEPLTRLLLENPGQHEEVFFNFARFLNTPNEKDGAARGALAALFQRLAGKYANVAAAHYVAALASRDAGQEIPALTELALAQTHKPEWNLPYITRMEWIKEDLQKKGQNALLSTLLAADARQGAETFLAQHPEDQYLRLQFARFLIVIKDYAGARRHFSWLIERHPDNPEILNAVILLAIEERDLPEARLLFERLAEVSPSLAFETVAFYLAGAEEKAGDMDRAISLLARISPQSKLYSLARLMTAMQMAERDMEGARRFLRESVMNTPEDRASFARMEAGLLRDKGLDAETYTVLSLALKAQPDHPELLYDAALAADKLRRWKEMENHLQRLIRLQPNNAHAYNALGYSFAERNLRLEEAQKLVNKALELDPQSPQILDSMGWVLYRRGQLSAALTALRAAYERLPDPEIAAHLGEVLWKMGREQEARELWQKEAEKSPGHAVLNATRQRFTP
ncbi:MAG: tetratricopeptide repeat protein [Zoogloeaceae bacterium]|jgi:Flp pilus assembly protein TadD|nr:tetratricopeptide repeat protein [Zoogloeaceae bacterium]